jgi:hypothetical protein
MGETKEVRPPGCPDGRVQTVQTRDKSKSLGKTSATTKFHQPKRALPATNHLFSNKIINPLAWIRVGPCQLATLRVLPIPFSISSDSRQFLSFCSRSESRVFFLDQSIISSNRSCIHRHLETYYRKLVTNSISAIWPT